MTPGGVARENNAPSIYVNYRNIAIRKLKRIKSLRKAIALAAGGRLIKAMAHVSRSPLK